MLVGDGEIIANVLVSGLKASLRGGARRGVNRSGSMRLTELRPLSFIYEAEHALPESVCRDMLQRFEAAVDEQYEGHVGQTVSRDQSVKRSTDLVASGKDHWRDVDGRLFRSLASAMNIMQVVFA